MEVGRHSLSNSPPFMRRCYGAKAITAGLFLLGLVPAFIVNRQPAPVEEPVIVDLSNDPHRTTLDDFQSL